MSATPRKDHVAASLGRIVAPLQADKFRNGVAAKIEPLQALEDLCWTILESLSIDGGTGIVLDRIGLIVGRGRNDLLDEPYRRLLRAQILVNRSNGSIPELVKILRVAVSDDAWSFGIIASGMSIEIHGFGPFDPLMTDALWSLLSAAKAAGVRLEYVGDVDGSDHGGVSDEPFLLDDDTNPASDGTLDTAHGFTDDMGAGEEDLATGGSLASDQAA